YNTTSGHYAYTANFFSSAPYTAGPLTALAGNNGLYKCGGGFPISSYNSANYWVDPVLSTSGADTTPPSVTSTAPASGATGVSVGTPVSATFSEAVDSTTVSMSVK